MGALFIRQNNDNLITRHHSQLQSAEDLACNFHPNLAEVSQNNSISLESS